jgi:hypothetical protein
MRVPTRITPHLAVIIALTAAVPQAAVSQSIPSPERNFGHVIGADRTLVDWDGIVDYLQLVGSRSNRVNVREMGRTTLGRPFLLVEIASAATMANLDRYKSLQQRLYFQDHRPGQDPESVHSDRQRQEIFNDHKAVVLITATIHSTEVGAAQMSLELVHHLATDDSPTTRKILDNTIFLLVPSLNPDGQDMVAEWYTRHVGTEYEAGSMPWLYHAYVGHDNNRDMYMYSQQETRLIGEVLYKEWFPSIWLDEHQMGSTGPRIFTMPATDPINPNVHPLVYTLNGIYGQAQAAALEAAGKVGIAYDYVYTNFWPGAMAWTGWWHNQVGMLTEVASVRIATPTEQEAEALGVTSAGGGRFRGSEPGELLPKPRDTQSRTSYARPWLGGKWTLRDIVDYELIVSLALLETAAGTRDQLLRQIYEMNRSTIQEFMNGESREGETDYGALPDAVEEQRAETGRVFAGFGGVAGTPYAIIIEPDQHDPPTVSKMLQTLERGGVIVERARSGFQANNRRYAAGTYVIRLAQVFGRYAKEMLETQTYPEVRATPESPPEPPYDVTAWSLGLQMGVDVEFVDHPFDASLEVVDGVPLPAGRVEGAGDTYVVSAAYNDAFKVVNQLWNEGAPIRRSETAFSGEGDSWYDAGAWMIAGVSRDRMEALAGQYGLTIAAIGGTPRVSTVAVRKPRIGVYQAWGSNMDEGWTRWLLDQYSFEYTTLHPQDFRAASGAMGDFDIPQDARSHWPSFVSDNAPAQTEHIPLVDRFDVILFADQSASSIVNGSDSRTTPPVYRGGIGDDGLNALRAFIDAGGTAVALGNATKLFVDHWPIPVKNAAEGLSNDELLIPGTIVNVETDPTHELAWGMPRESHGYFIRSPFFTLTEGFASQVATVAVRYPNSDVRASGWLRGGEYVAGRAAAVQLDFAPTAMGAKGGRIVLLGLRPQHRVQTHATFKILFNALVRGDTAVLETSTGGR